jgi:arylsulfatase A-like enzyme
MRRTWILATAISALLLATHFARAEDKPNVVIIVADGLGWDDVGYNGGPIKTPAIDALIGSGTSLQNFYVNPLGSPTRAGLMTGRQPIRLGLTYSDIKAWDNVGVHPDEHFMPQSFQYAGYQTALIGSWGLGHAQQTYHPNERGIDEFKGQLLLGSGLTPPFHNMGGVDLQHNGEKVDDSSVYLPHWMSEQASAYLRDRDPGKPVFLMLSFPSARSASDAPGDVSDKCRGLNSGSVADFSQAKSACGAYVASIEAMDSSIGKVMSALETEGLSGNTLVLFMSDSGSAMSGTGFNNAGQQGGRGQALEGGIHVPAALVWPGQLAPGSQFGSIVTMMDVFPTVAGAAGVKTSNERKLDGIDLWSAISRGKTVRRSEPVVLVSEAEQYGKFQLTAFDDRWKLVQDVAVDLVYIDVQNKLYRRGESVDETRDLSAQYPSEVLLLETAIKTIRQQHPITGLRNTMTPPPGWRGPKDWSEYPIALALLQDVTAAGSPPPFARRPLDWELGEKGRLIYDCEIKWWSLGFCIKNKEEDIIVYDFHKTKD